MSIMILLKSLHMSMCQRKKQHTIFNIDPAADILHQFIWKIRRTLLQPSVNREDISRLWCSIRWVSWYWGCCGYQMRQRRNTLKKSVEEDPPPDDMKDEKIVAVDTGPRCCFIKRQKYFMIETMLCKARSCSYRVYFARVEERKRCTMKKMCVYH